MNIEEWSNDVMTELRAAGFEVTLHHGFPLVTPPPFLDGKVKLLKFKASRPADRSIYAEGVLFYPAGTERLMRAVKEKV